MNATLNLSGWRMLLLAFLIALLSGCQSAPTVPCPPAQIVKPDLTGFPQALPEGYFEAMLRGWISEVSDD